MPKRLTDTSIWEKEWFLDLPPALKCFISYLDSHCDNAGVWNVNFRLAEVYIGAPVKDLIEKLPEGFYYEFDDGKKWFMPKFVEIQNGDIFKEPKEGKALSSIIKAVRNKLSKYKYKKENLYEFYYALSIGQYIYKEEYTYTEGEEYTGKGVIGGNPESKETPEELESAELTTTERIDGIVIHSPTAPDKLWNDDLWRSSLHDLFGIDDFILLPYWQDFWKHLRAGASQSERRHTDKIREHFRNWLNKQDFRSNGTDGNIDLSGL